MISLNYYDISGSKFERGEGYGTPGEIGCTRYFAPCDGSGDIDYSRVELGFFPELKPSSKTISIRLPESLLEAVKSLPTREMFPISRG
ncbi:MAG: CopG family antitoxin [bacterium]